MAPALAPVLEPVLFLLGSALLIAAVRWWRPDLSVRTGLAYAALVAAFFAVPLFTGALQLPTDLAYRWLPWRDAVPERVIAQNDLLSDVLLEQLPFHTVVRRRLLALEAPLWANEMGAGQPLLANAQSAPFAPLHLLALPLPSPRALTVSVAWEVLLMLLLMHVLLLRLGAAGPGAVFGAVAAGFSTYTIPWAYHPLGMAAAWIPGVLLGLVLLRHGEKRGLPGLVACGLGLATSGQPETLGYTALAAAMLAVVLVARPAPGRGRFILRLATAGALTACLAAPVLLPVLEQLPRSERMADVRRFEAGMQPPPFTVRLALPAIDPLVFGSPRDRNYQGPWNYNELCSGYAGLLALAFAAAGAVVFRGRIAAILLGGLAALLASLRLFPWYDLLHALPLLGLSAHGRLRLFWVLAVALAAGLSVGRLAIDRRSRLATAAALLLAATALAFLPPPAGAPWQRAWWLAALAGAAAAGTALLLPGARRRFAGLAVIALLFDLFLLGIRYHPVPAPGLDLSPPPALSFLIDRAQRVPEPFRVIADGYDLHANLAAVFGLWDPRHSDPMHPFGSSRFVRRRLKSGGKGLRLSAESYLAVRYRLTQHRRRLPPPWRPAFDGRGGKLWENPEALPLFFMPRRFLQVANERQVFARTLSWQAIRDFREMGVAAGGDADAVQNGVVREIRAGSNRFAMIVSSPAGGVVVSSVSYDPGWRVEVGGRRSPAFEVSSGFLGFRAPPGTHAVRIVYRPAGWTWGLVLFALGGLGGLGALADHVWRLRLRR